MRSARKFCIGVASIFVAVGALAVLIGVAGSSASALTMGDRRDCGYTDVIIDCGAITQTELLKKYDSNNDGRGNRDIQAIYNHYGIKRSDIAGTTSDVKRGWLNTNGVISVDGKTVATAAQSVYRVKVDKPVSPTKINGKTYYIGPVSGGYSKGADVFVFFRNGVFHSAIQASCGNPIPAEPEEEPVYRCDNLTAAKLDRTRYRFTASATARDGAEIVSYTFSFGDGKSETSSNNVIEHAYAAAGTYTARVSVNVRVDGRIQTVTDDDCTVTITVEEKPEKPVYRCDSLTARAISRERTFVYTLDYTAEGGATLDRVTFDFGDDTSETFTAADAINVEHQFANPGAYTTTATLYFDVGQSGETVEKSDSCEVRISIPKPEYCPLPGKEHLPKDSPDCKEENCPIPGKEHLPKDSPDCVETPPELPKTGLDMLIGGGLGIGSISAASYYWVASRKNLLHTLLNR